MTTSTDALERKIEKVIEEHLAACEAAAAVAVRNAFQRAARRPDRAPQKRRDGEKRERSRRRSPEAMEAICEQLYRAICQHPGETMAVIAPVVGETAVALKRPSVLLRRAGRVRSVGERQYTRYFPMDE